MGSIGLGSTAGGLVLAPYQATRRHLTQSDWGSQYRVPDAYNFTHFLHPARVRSRGDRPASGDRSMTRVRQAWRAAFAIAALMVLLCIPPDSEATDGRTYRAHGQVMAVNVAQAPHMIVVKTPLTKHNDMTVGAKVTAQTRIVRKGKRIALQTIRVGEVVWLTYVKQRDGVVARIIQVQ